MKMKAREYDWIDSYIGCRPPAESESEYPESVDVLMESDLLRTVVYTILLGGLASLIAYLSIRVAAGQGRSIFQLTATLAAFLACGAAASRRRKSLRFVLVLGALCAMALLVDQLIYYRWHQRIDRLVTSLQQGIDKAAPISSDLMKLQPTSFSIGPDQAILLTFEPPALAWTYHLDSASPTGHAVIAGWYRILSRASRGRNLDRIARTIVHPHETYSIGIESGEGTLACQESGKGDWILSIDARRGSSGRTPSVGQSALPSRPSGAS
jgi:hypothetical protein